MITVADMTPIQQPIDSVAKDSAPESGGTGALIAAACVAAGSEARVTRRQLLGMRPFGRRR